MATKKQQFAFYEDALEYILSIDAKNRHIGALASNYELKTKAGILYISLEEPEKSDVFSIYCRFEDEKKAKELIKDERLNIYSGKWNFHTFDATNTLTQFKYELTEIL